MSAIRVATRGERWPSGDHKVVAMLSVDDAWVQGLVDAPLIRDWEDGLGWWVGTGGRLDSGEVVELVRYENSPYPGFQLRIDSNSIAPNVMDEFIRATNIPADAIAWRLGDPERRALERS